MKVLKNNYEKAMWVREEPKKVEPYPRQLICEECESELEYEESDLEMGVLGCMHLRCPLCGYNNMVEDNENTITLTVDNIEFPTHFWHFSKETGAVDCCNNETIREYIRESIKNLRENKECHNWGYESGNLYVDVTRLDDDEQYDIVVSNNYYSAYIPFEAADY